MEYILEKVFTVPKPSPRVRTKPMKVICLGPSRSGTESLSIALKMLGYDAFHGFDIIYEENVGYIQEWAKLAQRKHAGSPDGDLHISTADFDAVLGSSDAVLDIGAFFFAEEIVKAYPDAKVILNLRRDLDAWHRSISNAFLRDVEDRWLTHFLRRLNAEIFWLWQLCHIYGFRPFFRSPNQGAMRHGLLANGKWVYRDHCNMVRGLVPKERLLEWAVEDGWEPLCEFLDKPCPDDPFPNSNQAAGFYKRIDVLLQARFMNGVKNLLVLTTFAGVLTTAIVIGVRRAGTSWSPLSWVCR